MTTEKRKAEELYSSDAKRGGGMVGAESQDLRPTTYVLPTWIDSKEPVSLGIPEVERRLVKNILLSQDPLEELAIEANNANNREWTAVFYIDDASYKDQGAK